MNLLVITIDIASLPDGIVRHPCGPAMCGKNPVPRVSWGEPPGQRMRGAYK